jgi:hypothetical protein
MIGECRRVLILINLMLRRARRRRKIKNWKKKKPTMIRVMMKIMIPRAGLLKNKKLKPNLNKEMVLQQNFSQSALSFSKLLKN